jgi:hypothetical protein
MFTLALVALAVLVPFEAVVLRLALRENKAEGIRAEAEAQAEAAALALALAA